LRELSAIRKANNSTLAGARVKVTRQSKDDTNMSAFKFEKV
jgi:hypothetical protein